MGTTAGRRRTRIAFALLASLALLAGCGPRADSDAGSDSGTCDVCPAEGVTECQAGGVAVVRTCAVGPEGCLRWEAAVCQPGAMCEAGACIPCSGDPGSFSGSTLFVDGDIRYYFMHVPAAYDCSTPWPIFIDHHGTNGPPAPEETWALGAAIAAADREGFILVRPRSRSSIENGFEIFRWDQNPGDPERNRDYVYALLADLSLKYRLDPERTYVGGFSSGTNQTSTVLSDPANPFKGYAFFGGGAWSVPSVPASTAGSRFYLTTGYRDYMRTFHYNLVELLDTAGIAPADRLIRDTDSGHDMYGWMYDEMWPFLDRGESPAAGTLAAGWTEEALPSPFALTTATVLAGGDLLAGGAGAGLLRRDVTDGSWSAVPVAGTSTFDREGFAAVCVTPAGHGLAVGNGLQATTIDGGDTWSFDPLPDVSFSPFGHLSLESAGCDATTITTGGYWSGATSTDALAWTDVYFDYPFGRAMVVSLTPAPWGTWLSTGYFAYIGRSIDGVAYADRPVPPDIGWFNDAAPIGGATWVVAAEKGQIVRSDDDGLTWEVVRPGPGDDLYAIAFRDDLVGLAVGRRGTALLTDDGGTTWTDVSAGVDRFLGHVHWLADGTALILGEGGAALNFDPGV